MPLIYDDDYDYEESTIPLNGIISQEPPFNAITPILPNIKDPEDSLIMGNEELSTIPEIESDKFIKSSVEDLIPIPITPLFDSNKDEYFTPGDDVELLLHHDPSTPMMIVVSILEGFTDEPPLEENDDLFDLEPKNDYWKKILIAPDLEVSRAHGFVHRPLEFQSLAYGNPIS
nr:hypothetical protein [Tanacetum cinerariifolium]